jgi:hypothetical protein
MYMQRPIASFVRHSSLVEVEIPLPDGECEPIRTKAEIVYDSFDALLHGTALRFENLSSRDEARIDAWLSTAERTARAADGRASSVAA